jgi:hypothetical protein
MKILYVATRGEQATTLSVDDEIAKLERLFSGSPARFTSIASIRAEDLPGELAKREFDILHITAHGEGHALQTLTDRGGTVLARPEQIAAFLLPRRKPRLIYLNACDSDPVARELVGAQPDVSVPFAIGATAPVASDYSIHGALAFYGRILLGGSIHEASEVARHQVELLASGRASLRLRVRPGADAHAEILMPEPEILAAMPGGLRKNGKCVEVMFGVHGAPEDTMQVVFFSDDQALADMDDDDTLAGQLCAVARGRVGRDGSMWCDRIESWDVEGNFRLFAVGVTAEGRRWTASGMLCEALRKWHLNLGDSDAHALPQKQFDKALHLLETWHVPKVRPSDKRPRHRKK